MELSLTVIGILGNITAVLLFLSPAPTFWKIIKTKSTAAYSAIPYICTLGNCLVWVFYGVPAVTQNNVLLLSINGIGIAFETIYIMIYIPYSQGIARVKVMLMVFIELVLYGVMIAVAMGAFDFGQKRTLFVGIIAAIFNILMYAAPLAAMKTVIQTRSVESMPFLLSLCTLINSILWLIYGVIRKDAFIIVPNVLGVKFGIMQLVLYGCYRNATPINSNGNAQYGNTRDDEEKRRVLS